MALPPPLHLGARVRRAALLAAAIVGFALIMPASAAPGAESTPPNTATQTADVRGVDELPSGDGYLQSGVVASTQGIVARASKMYITINADNPILGALRYARHNDPIENPTRYRVKYVVPWPFDAPPCATVPPEQFGLVQYVYSDLTAFSATSDGVLDEVGALPSTRVNLLAFGSVPASATISMKMVRKDGRVVPWPVHIWAPGSTSIPGCKNGTDYYRALIEGQVEVAIRDLKVDGVPVDVGPECRTERPVDLQLWGEGGYEALRGGYLGQFDGLATGTRIRLESPYYFEDNGRGLIPDSAGVDIPPFVGCGTGGDDLSVLVTAMASGPDNPMRVNQGQPMFQGVDPNDVFKCDAPGLCPLPAPKVPPMPPLPWKVAQ